MLLFLQRDLHRIPQKFYYLRLVGLPGDANGFIQRLAFYCHIKVLDPMFSVTYLFLARFEDACRFEMPEEERITQ